jgi:hypothetical protein
MVPFVAVVAALVAATENSAVEKKNVLSFEVHMSQQLGRPSSDALL